MSIIDILDTVIFKPLILLFEVIFNVAGRDMMYQGTTLIILSIVINVLVLPLYKRADLIQREQFLIEEKLKKGVSHIKKTFKGNERIMMLSAYYRQNGYKPHYALRSALPLLLQIPFFVSAYRYLSGALSDEPFLCIASLARPDGLLHIGGFQFNLLPVIMTIINIISSSVYMKGRGMKERLQLYAMAAFFLVFLYSSPAGLVFYWTLNNIFSFFKNIFGLKIKKLTEIIGVFLLLVGISLFILGIPSFDIDKTVIGLILCVFSVFILYTVAQKGKSIFSFIKKKEGRLSAVNVESNKEGERIFWYGALFLSLFTGLLIPLSVISDSPQEFINFDSYLNPLWFSVSSFCYAFGIFTVWLGIYYKLVKPSLKIFFERAVWILSGIVLLDYMLFSRNFGNLGNNLKYEEEVIFTLKENILNGFSILFVIFLFSIIYEKKKRIAKSILLVGSLAVLSMSLINTAGILKSVNTAKAQFSERDKTEPILKFSRTGKNVIVFMIDTGVGAYVPYIFNEKPELMEKFSGFTYYSNVISFGARTQYASPPLFGGYEYTPYNINKRENETLVSKHNEALKVMPVLFSQNGYDVTVCDPTFANYEWIPDLSIYDGYPNISAYITNGAYNDDPPLIWIKHNMRNFFCYGILRSSPTCLQGFIYDRGNYYKYKKGSLTEENPAAMNAYNVLKSLPKMSSVSEDSGDTFLLFTNDTPHDTMLYQAPDYVPSEHVDNTEYEEELKEKRGLKRTEWMQEECYHSNMAALMRLGEWFDYLKEEGVYDNTRIIIVADHGSSLRRIEELVHNDRNVAAYFPLLMVKDFGSSEFSVSGEFMTNGDVPTIAVKGIIEDPHNPFTGQPINSDEKKADKQYIYGGSTDLNKESKLYPSNSWYSVHDDIWDAENWTVEAEDACLPD